MQFIATSDGTEIYYADQGDGNGFPRSQIIITLTLCRRGGVCSTRRSTP
jgi:hypothetical protein